MDQPETTLIVLRGPSGSGKSSVARAVRSAWERPMALIEQDYLRRVVLKEKDVPDGLNIQLIKKTVLFALENGLDVVMEGIFDRGRYQRMFEDLILRHPHRVFFFYFDISLAETFRRHQSKPNRHEFGEKEMRGWYKERDLLSCAKETLIPETNSLEQTADFVSSICGAPKRS